MPEAPDNRLAGCLEEAYQRYRGEPRRFFVQRLRDPDAVDDLIQAMYLSLRRRPPSDEVRDPRQYLFGVAWNLLHRENHRIAAERSQSVTCELSEFDAYADRSNRLWVEDDTASEQQQEELDRVFGMLPAACQVTLLRQYRDNWSYADIARELGVTTHTVKKYVMQALNHFRRHFNSSDSGASREAKRR